MIRLEAVHRCFRVGEQRVHALNGIDLAVGKGDYVAVMGPSGSGKSTLLNIIALLDKPSSGRYLFDGKAVNECDDDELARIRRCRIGFVFQFFHLIARLTALENIAVPMVLAGVPGRERQARARQALADVGLTSRAEHRPSQLSGGQLQRIAIARAMIMRPDIVLADEPTGNLDSRTGIEIIELLENLNQSGVTLMIITHDPALGGRAARKLRMIDGRLQS